MTMMETRPRARMIPQTVDEVLDLAADRIQRQGWCQEGYGASDGPLCMIGAVCETTVDTHSDLYKDARRHLGTSLAIDGYVSPHQIMPVIIVNDTIFTRKSQAVAALRRAARRARGEQVRYSGAPRSKV